MMMAGLLGLLMMARPAEGAKVVIAPGKTECISSDFGAEHFEVRRMRDDVTRRKRSPMPNGAETADRRAAAQRLRPPPKRSRFKPPPARLFSPPPALNPP